MQYVIPAIFLAILAYYAWSMIGAYKATTGTVEQRLLAAGKGSATKLWAKIVGVVSTALGFVVSMADYLNAPQVSDFIHQYLPSQTVAAVMLGIMVVVEIARNRTLVQ